MKHINKILLLMTLLAGFSCTREELPLGGEDSKAPRIVISADEVTQVQSRALPTEPGSEDERSFNELYLYAFKAGVLVHSDKKETNKFPYSMSLPMDLEGAGELKFYLFSSPTGTVMPTGKGTDAATIATPARLEALITTGMSLHTAGEPDGTLLYAAGAQKIPMAVAVQTHDFKVNGSSVSAKLTRVVSKLRVRIEDKINGAAGVLAGDRIEMQIINCRDRVGYMPTTLNPAAERFTSQWITMDAHNETITTTIAPISTNKWMYAYLNENLVVTDRAVMTLRVPYKKGTDPENFYTYEVPLDFNLMRNHIYQVRVEIFGPGKADMRIFVEALPWNVEEHNIDSEGSFTLSNDEFVAYADQTVSDNDQFVVVSVKAFGKSEGTVVDNFGNEIATFPAQTAGTEIKIHMGNATLERTLTFTQDGVSKTMKATLKQQLLIWDTEIKHFANGKYTSLECLTSDRFKIATEQKTYTTATELKANEKVLSTGNGFYFYTEDNTSLSYTPTTTFMVHDADGKSTRVLFKRDAAPIYKQYPDFYVGTFHRHDQFGERIIQRPNPLDKEKYNEWGAKAISGGDWIVLDGDENNITWPAGAAAVGVDTKKLPATATNTIASHTGHLKFRLGLTGVNPSAPVSGQYDNGKPRYGLVLVGYADRDASKNHYHRIYVRQGHDADYVFERTGAVKFSPYDLVANGYVSETDSRPYTITSTVFADYPSRLGSRFTATNGAAAYPASAHFLPNNNVELVEAELTKIYALCPSGYRVPGSEAGNGTVIPAQDNGDVLTNGEFAKSIFLGNYSLASRWTYTFAWEIYKNPGDYPTDGSGGVQNRVEGYYADGLVDRVILPAWVSSTPAKVTDGCFLHNDAYYSPRVYVYYNDANNANVTFSNRLNQDHGMYAFRAGVLRAGDDHGGTSHMLMNRWCWINPLYEWVTVHYTVPERGTQTIRCVK